MIECPECASDEVDINGDDTGCDWYECAECGFRDFNESPTRRAIVASRKRFVRKMYYEHG